MLRSRDLGTVELVGFRVGSGEFLGVFLGRGWLVLGMSRSGRLLGALLGCADLV